VATLGRVSGYLDEEIRRSYALIQDEVANLGALLRMKWGECDGVSLAGEKCTRPFGHRGEHLDGQGASWLDAE